MKSRPLIFVTGAATAAAASPCRGRTRAASRSTIIIHRSRHGSSSSARVRSVALATRAGSSSATTPAFRGPAPRPGLFLASARTCAHSPRATCSSPLGTSGARRAGALVCDATEGPGLQPTSGVLDETRRELGLGLLTMRTQKEECDAAEFHLHATPSDEAKHGVVASLMVNAPDPPACATSAGCWIRLQPNRANLAVQPEVGFLLKPSDTSIHWSRAPVYGHPDQFRRECTAAPDYPTPADSGHNSWTPLPDGRIVMVDYTNSGSLESYSWGGKSEAAAPFVRADLVTERDLVRPL